MIRGLVISFVVGAALGGGGATAAHYVMTPKDTAQAFAETWMGLLERCRTAVETGGTLDGKGLVPTTERVQNALSRLNKSHNYPAWRLPDEERVVAVMIEPEEAGSQLRGCNVEMADANYRVHPNVANAFLYALMKQQAKLTSEGTHVRLDERPIVSGFFAGYQTLSLNPSGCAVHTIVSFDDHNGIGLVASSEKIDPPCRGLSALTPDGGTDT